MPGFTEYSGLYRKYRVNGFMATCSFANLEAVPMLCYLSVLNSDPGTSVIPGTAQTLLAQPLTQKALVGPLTGNSALRQMSINASVASFGGSSNKDIDDSYSAFVTGTAPANNIWLLVGAFKQSGTAAAGVLFDLTIDIDKFFEVNTPSA